MAEFESSLVNVPFMKIPDDRALAFGAALDILWDTSDANANCGMINLPSGGSIDVPVLVVGIGIKTVDLGMFDGLTQPLLGIVDADRDSFVSFTFSSDDTPVIREKIGAAAAINLTLPTSADTLVGRGTTDTLTNKTLTSPAINGTITTTGLTLPAVTFGEAIAGGDQAFTNVGDMTFAAGSILASGSTNGDTLLLRANDTTFITLTTGVTDTMDLGAHTISGDIVPSSDNARLIGSATVGLLGVHIAGNFYLKQVDVNTLGLYSSDEGGFKVFQVYSITLGAGGVEYSGTNGLFRPLNSVSGNVAFQGYGSGAYVEHAKLAPNNFDLVNGLAVGTTGLAFSDVSEGVKAATIKTVKVTKAHNADLFDAAALTDSATIWTQPAGTVLLAVKMRVTTQFDSTGDLITDLDVTLGDVGDNDGLVSAAMNLITDAANTEYKTRGAYWDTSAEGCFWYAHSATDWIGYATAVGANLSTTTAGSLDFYFTYLEL